MDLQSEMIPNVDGLAYVGGEWDASKYAPFDVDKDKIILSVCDPNLNISEKTYTTKEPSRIIKKQLELKGLWKPTKNSKQTEISYKANSTSLTVYCQHGQPVEITLINLPQ